MRNESRLSLGTADSYDSSKGAASSHLPSIESDRDDSAGTEQPVRRVNSLPPINSHKSRMARHMSFHGRETARRRALHSDSRSQTAPKSSGNSNSDTELSSDNRRETSGRKI